MIRGYTIIAMVASIQLQRNERYYIEKCVVYKLYTRDPRYSLANDNFGLCI